MRGEIFPRLVNKLGEREPETMGRRAAVSVILSGRIEPQVLLIKRSERLGDPWSGQVAFPGGKYKDGDGSARGTAVREAKEEVGIDLEASSEFLGYFRSFRTHTGDMDVVPALFLLKEEAPVRANEEVASHAWVDLTRLTSDEAKFTHRLNFEGQVREVPAFRVGDYIIWGLTHRMIAALVDGKSV